MKKLYFTYFTLLMAVLLCMTGCSKDEESHEYKMYSLYREANIPAITTVVKNGQSYRPVHFIVLEYSRSKIYRYEVYNNDAVAYYGITGLSSIPGFNGWYYDTNAVATIGCKVERGKFTLEDDTVLEWVVSDDYQVTALKDNTGIVQYVGWKPNDEF